MRKQHSSFPLMDLPLPLFQALYYDYHLPSKQIGFERAKNRSSSHLVGARFKQPVKRSSSQLCHGEWRLLPGTFRFLPAICRFTGRSLCLTFWLPSDLVEAGIFDVLGKKCAVCQLSKITV